MGGERLHSVLETDDFAVFDFEAVVELDRFIGGFLAGANHSAEGSAHAGVTVVFRELHAADDEAGEDFARVIDDEACLCEKKLNDKNGEQKSGVKMRLWWFCSRGRRRLTFGLVHVHRTHVAELNEAGGAEALDAEGAKGAIVTTGADDDGCSDG